MGEAVDRLRRAGCVAAEEEAAELVDRAPDASTLDAWLARREQGEPLQWITGRVRFGGRWYAIDPGVYVPRPQTEDLARRAVEYLPAGGLALDLCCGAGVIAAHLAAAVPSATVIGVDVDPVAVACARRNGVLAVVGDLAEPICPARRFDVITAVPPYVPTEAIALLAADVQRYEPRLALDGGVTGLDVLERTVAAAASRLRAGGRLLIELGGTQAVALAEIVRRCGLDDGEPWFDDDGDLRGLIATR